MSTEPIPLGFADLAVQGGSHIAYPYGGEDERYEKVLDFVSAGLRNGEKCIAAIPEYTTDFWQDGLRSRGMDDSSMDRFEILTARELFHGSIAESPSLGMETLGRTLESSLAEGRTRIRACTGFSHMYNHREAVPDLLAAESEANDFVSSEHITMLCTFSKVNLHPRLLETTLQCHPLITDGDSLDDNADYVSPEEFARLLPEIMDQLGDCGAFVPPFALLDFYGEVPVIRACAEMDFYTSPKLEELANQMISLNHRRLIVDLSDTTFADASTVHLLARLAQTLEDKGGQLSIFDPMGPARKIFRLARLEEYIPIRGSMEEASDAAFARALAE